MAYQVKMPKLGLTMSEGAVLRWMKKEGEYVEKGEILVEVESDKSSVEFESPESGYVKKILVQEGETVPILTDIAILGAEDEAVEATETKDVQQSPVLKNDMQPAQLSTAGTGISKLNADVASSLDISGRDGMRIFASPAAKKVAGENGVDLALIPIKSGKERIEKADVMSYLRSRTHVKATPLAVKIAEVEGINLSDIVKKEGERVYSVDLPLTSGGSVAADMASDRKIPVNGMRKVIAKRMKESVLNAPHVSLTTEVDMSNAMDLRNRVKDDIIAKFGVKVSVNDIVILCTARALRSNPRVNSVFTEEGITIKGEINLGMAVAMEEGLIVPVVRNADKKGLGEIAAEAKQLAEKARTGRLSPGEYEGGTFTVSNLGMYDITQFNSIINQPESAILSVSKAVERPVSVDGQISVKPMMNLTITFDHRPMDGAMAAKCLKDIKTLLEDPYKLLLEGR
ncbi:MAG: 2-oxo acid dehydrogenase subunit E2 [Clostridia bacterium]|nr:2-oxo acid dehydrogenase subunit E2 [Clostridia bacterium]